jgi:2-oxoglutarate ferredoxin oxidoreductase subunit delta
LAMPAGVADEGETVKHWRKPLDSDKYSPPRGLVHLIPDRCKGCAFCVEFCPKEVLEVSDEFNSKGYHIPRVKPETDCVACLLCERICPDFAIFIERLDEEEVAEKKPAKGKKGAKT